MDTAQSGGGDGFWSNLSNAAQTGLNTVLTDIAPRWVGNQLGVQQTNQLNQDTRGPQPNNIDTSTVVSKSPSVALILLAGGALLTLLILKKA